MAGFLPADIDFFAALSGDANPLHTDAIAARRLIFGRPVAHGIHVALWAMDRWLERRPGSIGGLTHFRAQFKAPVPVGATPDLVVVSDDGKTAKLEVALEGQRCCLVTIAPGDANSQPTPDRRPSASACRDRSLAKMANASGSVTPCLDLALAVHLYPRLTAAVPAWQLAALAATTRVVGMDCPGLHSVYSELDASFEPLGGGDIVWRAAEFDERVNRLRLEFQSPGFHAQATVFIRPKPRTQKTTVELKAIVAPGTFASQRALVVGGSRGLGEVAAKLLAAGGADVVLTYHRGEADARRVVDDIRSVGGSARAVALDVTRVPADISSCLGQGWVPTSLYFFSSPPIFIAAAGRFQPALFRQFIAYYVDGFHAVVTSILALGGATLTVFYPSSVAVDETPANMGEYAAAKAAGEKVCRFLAAAHKTLSVFVERLPRLATDQTATLLAVNNEDPVPVINSILMQMAGGNGRFS